MVILEEDSVFPGSEYWHGEILGFSEVLPLILGESSVFCEGEY